MAQTSTTVKVFFGETATGSTTFTLDHPTLGLLDGAGLLGGDSGTDISAYVARVQVRRGKSGLIFDQFDAGIASVVLNNEARTFDPLYAAGPYFGDLVPGKRVLIKTDEVTIFDGKVSDWNLEYDVSGRNSAIMECEDALAILGRQEFDEWTTTASQTAGPRLTAVLNRSEVAWNGGARDLDTGASVLQADLVTWGSNVLNYCQLVSQSDFGSFFCSRTGLLTFRDRRANLGGTPDVAFADDGTGTVFHGVSVQSGAEMFYTRVSVDREGGTKQTVVTASADADGVRSLSLAGLLMDTDAQSLDMATYIANVYSTGGAIVSGIVCKLHTESVTTAQALAVLAMDINSLSGITWTPGNPRLGAATVQTGVVIGVDHDIVPIEHTVSLYLDKFDGRQPFILDDPVTGVLDGPGLLVF